MDLWLKVNYTRYFPDRITFETFKKLFHKVFRPTTTSAVWLLYFLNSLQQGTWHFLHIKMAAINSRVEVAADKA